MTERRFATVQQTCKSHPFAGWLLHVFRLDPNNCFNSRYILRERLLPAVQLVFGVESGRTYNVYAAI